MDKILNLFSSIPCDKLGHFVAGVFIYAIFHFVSPLFGLVVVAVAAIGKEIYDYDRDRINGNKRTPDIWDTVATMLGGVLGFISGL